MQHINSFNKGMIRGIDYTIIPQNSYLYMLNGCLISRDEKGFVVTAIKGTKTIAQFDAQEVPIGSISFNGILYIITHKKIDSEQFVCVYSYKGSNGNEWVEQMMIVPNGPDNLCIPYELLGFSRNKLLQVFAKESFDGSVDLYICDGLNPNAVINTGLDKTGKRTDRQYKSFDNKVQFLFHKSITKAPDVSTAIRNVGNLKPGSYYFYLRYEDETLNATPFIREVGPVHIHVGSLQANNVSGALNEDNNRISKSIVLNITNADPLYKKVSVGVVFYFGVDGILSRENFLIDKSYDIVDNKCTVVFSGDNAIRSLLVEEIIADNIQYNISETHLQLDNRYYGANWKGGDIDYNNLKELAKRIIPRAIIHPENNLNKYHDEDEDKYEYLENEIYSFGVSFLIDGRYKTPVFPILGWFEGKTQQNVIRVPELPIAIINKVDYEVKTTSFKTEYQVFQNEVLATEIGILWKLGSKPTISNYDGIDSEASGSGTFIGEATSLTPETTYKVVSYAKIPGNYIAEDTYVYSGVREVKTLAGVLSIILIETGEPSAYIGLYSTTITYSGDDTIGEVGFVISESAEPTISDRKIVVGSGTGTFNVEIDDLTPLTKYYIRAYCYNYAGVNYSNEIEFTTKRAYENVALSAPYDIGLNWATFDVSVEPDSGSIQFINVGICWGTQSDPRIDDDPARDDQHKLIGVIDGSTYDFTTQITGLVYNRQYYVRAYATNENGTYYSNQRIFTTLSGVLQVTTLEPDPLYISDTWANIKGSILDANGGGVKSFGICYKPGYYNPTINDGVVYSDINSSMVNFMCVLNKQGDNYELPGLIRDMQYFARAFAINNMNQVFYGQNREFWTLSAPTPDPEPEPDSEYNFIISPYNTTRGKIRISRLNNGIPDWVDVPSSGTSFRYKLNEKVVMIVSVFTGSKITSFKLNGIDTPYKFEGGAYDFSTPLYMTQDNTFSLVLEANTTPPPPGVYNVTILPNEDERGNTRIITSLSPFEYILAPFSGGVYQIQQGKSIKIQGLPVSGFEHYSTYVDGVKVADGHEYGMVLNKSITVKTYYSIYTPPLLVESKISFETKHNFKINIDGNLVGYNQYYEVFKAAYSSINVEIIPDDIYEFDYAYLYYSNYGNINSEVTKIENKSFVLSLNHWYYQIVVYLKLRSTGTLYTRYVYYPPKN